MDTEGAQEKYLEIKDKLENLNGKYFCKCCISNIKYEFLINYF